MSTFDDAIKIWRVYCIHESVYVITYDVNIPTLCPNNHIDRTIDTSKTRLLNYVSQNKVTVEEPTSGNYQATTYGVNVPAGLAGDITTYDVVWPMDIDLWKVTLMTDANINMDTINVIVGPETTIGVLTQDAFIGDTLINITGATFSTPITTGAEIILYDGVNKNDMGRIINLDADNFQITCETSLTNNFLAGTLLKINFYMLKNYTLALPNYEYKLADKGFRYKKIPANTISRIYMTNSDGAQKNICFNIEYYY